MTRVALMGGREWTADFSELYADILGRTERKEVLWLVLFADGSGGALGEEIVANDFYAETAKRLLGPLGGSLVRHRVRSRGDAASAELLAAVGRAEWIHLFCVTPEDGVGLLGGTPLAGALDAAGRRGALLTGASGAAILLCQQAWSIPQEVADQAKRAWNAKLAGEGTGAVDLSSLPIQLIDCLQFAPPRFFLPHFDKLESVMIQFIQLLAAAGTLRDDNVALCVDDGTAVTNLDGAWRVRGAGQARLVSESLEFRRFPAGTGVPFPIP